MSAEFLNSFIEDAADYARELATELAAGRLDWPGLLILCEAHRQAGVCGVFLHGDTAGYLSRMVCSAGALDFFLQNQPAEGVALSKAEPLIDCINGRMWAAAARLGNLCPQQANTDYEYPEDFSYFNFLLRFGVVSEAEAQAAFDAFASVATDADEFRVAVCEALLTAAADDFHENLCLLLEQRAEEVEARIGRGALTDAQAAWQRYFCNEGLALLRIAQRSELPLDTHYLHVPEELLTAPATSYDPDAWRRS